MIYDIIAAIKKVISSAVSIFPLDKTDIFILHIQKSFVEHVLYKPLRVICYYGNNDQ